MTEASQNPSVSPSILAILLLTFAVTGLLQRTTAQDYKAARLEMVRDQMERRQITNPIVLRAMRSVPRHEFLAPPLRRLAYRDRAVPIGYGQTISQPFIVAFMTQAIEPLQDYRVLEVGTGSGYQAAVLAEIVDTVFTIEIIEELAATAAERLDRLEYRNVVTRQGDGYFGWPEKGPFDAIVVTAASQHIPPPLLEQLKEGGRLIIPVGTPFFKQSLLLVEKVDGRMKTTSLLPVRFVPFTRSKD